MIFLKYNKAIKNIANIYFNVSICIVKSPYHRRINQQQELPGVNINHTINPNGKCKYLVTDS